MKRERMKRERKWVDAKLAAEVARGLIEIARLAMPDTYFASDSRVNAARRLLKALGLLKKNDGEIR